MRIYVGATCEEGRQGASAPQSTGDVRLKPNRNRSEGAARRETTAKRSVRRDETYDHRHRHETRRSVHEV